jgi:hypothetical protein
MSFWLRRRDTQAFDALVAALDDEERAEARELYTVPGVPETLYTLPLPELLARMAALAGQPAKAAEA